MKLSWFNMTEWQESIQSSFKIFIFLDFYIFQCLSLVFMKFSAYIYIYNVYLISIYKSIIQIFVIDKKVIKAIFTIFFMISINNK